MSPANDSESEVLLARKLMLDFASRTGLTGERAPRRYLWTDAFAVCNFLGLFRQTGEEEFRWLAVALVDQAHHVLGRHRTDDARTGWISGLSEAEGERHPTAGGLRIGKSLNERAANEPFDPQAEWDRDGQYFHYLTKWLHALYRMAQETGDQNYSRWGAELLVGACAAFTLHSAHGAPKRIAWKMSIDLSRPLIALTGQHDALDGLIAALELQSAIGREANEPELSPVVAEMTELCTQGHWITDDLLGIGGLLDGAARLAQLVFRYGAGHSELLYELLRGAELSLRNVDDAFLRSPVEYRLPFRELGLSIGLKGLALIEDLSPGEHAFSAPLKSLLWRRSLAERIEGFWSAPEHQLGPAWRGHEDINSVMLATSLAPDSYLHV